MPPKSQITQISRMIARSIAELFAEPDFDSDAGDVRQIDHDDRCVWLGLFLVDEDGAHVSSTPSVTWTIEISCDQ